MQISDIIERTGLTKKAIRYYEQAGLITPEVNPTNQYREYTTDDLNRLMQIGVLRKLGFAVKEVGRILESPDEWREILQNQHTRLQEDIQRLEQNKQVIEVCLNLDKGEDLPTITHQLSLLNRSLELDAKGREGYMQQALERIFPGYFGKMITIHFGHFLAEPLDTPEKEQAWLELVTFLDEMEEIEYPDSYKELLDQLPPDYLTEYQEHSRTYTQKMISPTEEELAEQKKQLENFTTTLSQDPDFKATYAQSIKMKKTISAQLEKSGYYQKFVEKLKILSDSYRSYHQTLQTLQEQVDLTELQKMYDDIT